MDHKEKTNHEKMFQDAEFPFPFKKFEKMADLMRSCCPGKGSMADCCSMMKKMMGYGEGKETITKEKETGEDI